MIEFIQGADEIILRWIAETIRVSWLDGIVVFYTSLGNGGWIFIALSVFMLLHRSTRKVGSSALVSMLFGLLITNLTIKPLVARPRPWIALEEFTVLITSSDMNSFPSGHTCAAFAFAVSICLSPASKWMKTTAVVAAVFMGLSRLYVGVHFPTDVLAGAGIGAVCSVLGVWCVQLFIRWYRNRKALK